MIAFDISEQDIKRANKVLSKLTENVQFSAYDNALRPAGKVIADRAAQILEAEAKKPRTRRKMSNKAKQIWPETPLSKLLRIKVLRGGKAVRKNTDPYALIGPKYPDGSKANFIHPMRSQVRQRVYWGKRPANLPSVTPKDNDFLKRAADETRPQQVRVFLRHLIKDVRKRIAKDIQST